MTPNEPSAAGLLRGQHEHVQIVRKAQGLLLCQGRTCPRAAAFTWVFLLCLMVLCQGSHSGGQLYSSDFVSLAVIQGIAWPPTALGCSRAHSSAWACPGFPPAPTSSILSIHSPLLWNLVTGVLSPRFCHSDAHLLQNLPDRIDRQSPPCLLRLLVYLLTGPLEEVRTTWVSAPC